MFSFHSSSHSSSIALSLDFKYNIGLSLDFKYNIALRIDLSIT